MDEQFIKPSANPLYKELKILTINDIYALETGKFVYDSLHKLNPIQFHTFFNYTNCSINTTNVREKKLKPPAPRTTTYGTRSIKFSGAHIWNNIPQLNRELKSRNLLIFKLKNSFNDSSI